MEDLVMGGMTKGGRETNRGPQGGSGEMGRKDEEERRINECREK